MKLHSHLLACCALVGLSVICAIAQEQEHVKTQESLVSSTAASPTPSKSASYDSKLSTEGEQRFRSNSGRCHLAPQKFPPRMMATIVRHMRVRATLTDEDMRLILQYMTQ